MSLPTVYEYYTSHGITAGLSDAQPYFTLNNKNITLYSGAMHYFRVPQEYWRDRLRKMRAAGLNTVETYVPWNLHEPEPGVYDFGNGGTDFQDLLDIEKFLKIAQEEDLLAIVRPGPYICSEWEFGGLPSWLLREKGLQVRSSEEKFMSYVEKYFKVLLAILTTLQFTKGGPIIAMQIENEFGSVGVDDLEYLERIKEVYLQNGIVELLFTSDGSLIGNKGQVPGILYTANFQTDAKRNLDALEKYQKNKPAMSMEYWDGWFDHWSESHHTTSLISFRKTVRDILDYPGSINFYMFHGGTNFGFLNGANVNSNSAYNIGFQPTTSSYDYDAPLNEFGNYTKKYYATREILQKYNTKVIIPEIPPITIKQRAYDGIDVTESLNFDEIIAQVDNALKIKSKNLLKMEMLPINNNSGQSYGYIVYRTHLDIAANSTLKIKGHLQDTLMVLINGKLISKPLESLKDLDGFGYWRLKDGTLNLGPNEYKNATLDLVIENWGRVNFGNLNQFNAQKKGLDSEQVLLNEEIVYNWVIIPLEFKKNWNNNLKNWKPANAAIQLSPTIYRATINIEQDSNIDETFVDMTKWNKGVVIVNGFVLSRYAKIGPQQTAYLPGAFLVPGLNEILIFEHFTPSNRVEFSREPIFKTV